MSAKVSFETVRKIGLAMPHVEAATAWGKPALKVYGKMFVCMSSHKSAEPDSLVVRTDLEQRAELLASAPDIYYITEHYRDYPAVLVRLARVNPELLPDLLKMAYRLVASKAGGEPKKSGPKKRKMR